ncbi:MAG: helix-turn-helix domain-containing protein [Pseudonocardiaceae bacterium]
MPEMPTGQLIRLYRIDRKKNTTSVATHAGITVRYLEMIEAGGKTPSVDVLRKIAKVLRVRTAALLGEAPSEDHEGPVNPRIAEIERALFTYRSVSLFEREVETDLHLFTSRWQRRSGRKHFFTGNNRELWWLPLPGGQSLLTLPRCGSCEPYRVT